MKLFSGRVVSNFIFALNFCDAACGWICENQLLWTSDVRIGKVMKPFETHMTPHFQNHKQVVKKGNKIRTHQLNENSLPKTK